mgnify:CR=1 FL=1
MPWVLVDPVIEPSVRGLCVRPYPLHPKGCPNFGKKIGCPPDAPIYRPVGPVAAIFNIFPLACHVRWMRDRHPDWSDRQLRCVLYWQPAARKQLKAEIRKFLSDHRGWRIIACPEACGVNLTQTMAEVGIRLEWPPEEFAYQIVLADQGDERHRDSASGGPPGTASESRLPLAAHTGRSADGGHG